MHPAIPGADMRELRRGVGLSQRQLAIAMGYSVQSVKLWERNDPPMPDHVCTIFLNVIMARQYEREHLMNLYIVAKAAICAPLRVPS